jgi:hypothetical protein
MCENVAVAVVLTCKTVFLASLVAAVLASLVAAVEAKFRLFQVNRSLVAFQVFPVRKALAAGAVCAVE